MCFAQHRIYHKIYCQWYKLASAYNLVTVLCIMSPRWQDCCTVKCCRIEVWMGLPEDLSHFLPSWINMLSLTFISPGDCKLCRRTGRVSTQVAGACVSTCLHTIPPCEAADGNLLDDYLGNNLSLIGEKNTTNEWGFCRWKKYKGLTFLKMPDNHG